MENEKHIMNASELVEEYKKKINYSMNLDYMETRLQENCVEIAINVLSKMQNVADIGRDILIRDYISLWAKEAEMEWIKILKGDDEYNHSYYDFIDEFSEKKFKEFEEAMNPKKKAKLVSFVITTRVIVDEGVTECEDAEELAMMKIKDNIHDYICLDNIESVSDDTEVPYNKEIDG